MMPKKSNHKSAAYERRKKRVAARGREESAAARECSPLPKIKNRRRRKKALAGLRVFCETYGKELIFKREWSAAHLKAIAKLERVIKSGGKFALAMPRGRGKTGLFIFAALWAVLNGYRRFVFVIAANAEKAKEILDGLRTILTSVEKLRDDFPEVCHPLWQLEGIHQRKLLYKGKPLIYSIKSSPLVLPNVPHSAASEAVIKAAGLHSAIRGTFYIREGGEWVRPDLLLIDDPQTDESAESTSQTDQRWTRLKAAVMGMSGSGETIAAMAAVTVIQEDDLAEKLLDAKTAPEWQGERFSLMPVMPESELWDEYARIRNQSLAMYGDIRLATDFYMKNRSELDAGAEVMWLADYKTSEKSAIQSAMNLYFEDAATFWAEMQQQPSRANSGDEDALTADEIKHRLNGLERYIVPTGTTMLTAFIDVQKSLFFYAVVAWREGFTGDVIDYGTYPEQKRTYFTKRDAQRRFEHLTIGGVKLKGLSVEERWLKSLGEFTGSLLSKEWKREDGTGTERIQRALIDAQYGDSTEIIYRFLKTCPHRAILLPSHGDPIGPTSTPFNERRPKDNERRGDHWVLGLGERQQLRVRYDANYFKTFLRNRLAVDARARGAIRFWGSDPSRHQMAADHVMSEKPIKVTAKGRDIVIFSKPDGDNDLLDCFSGNCICASTLGLTLEERAPRKPKKKRDRVSYLDI